MANLNKKIDENLFTVLNTTQTNDYVGEFSSHHCPNKNPYKQERIAKYYGLYKSTKLVSSICELEAIVIVYANNKEAKVLCKNSKLADETLIIEAKDRFKEHDNFLDYKDREEEGWQVFLFKNEVPVEFHCDYKRGLAGPFRYFDNLANDVCCAKSLAKKLNTKHWDDFLE